MILGSKEKKSLCAEVSISVDFSDTIHVQYNMHTRDHDTACISGLDFKESLASGTHTPLSVASWVLDLVLAVRFGGSRAVTGLELGSARNCCCSNIPWLDGIHCSCTRCMHQ